MNSNAAKDISFEETFSERQSDVLAAAFAVLMDGGAKSLTMAGVAAAANCSKESLYKWFGDREGLLAAMVINQAAQVPAFPNQADVRSALILFGQSLIEVLLGSTSIALNRLSIGDALADKAVLGELLMKNGRGPIRARGCALLEDAKAAGEIHFDDVGSVYSTYYGLLVGDRHTNQLLGQTEKFDTGAQAAMAVAQLYQLYPNTRN